ncbi:MAG: helix-turn-helix domain-containing protein [Polaribacter sp.]|nr:helix-turn-helix domain-containing protein [Polaribacter sp.]
MKNKKYSGVWIPKEVLNNGIKNGNERILFAMISSLSKKEPCSASNKYLSELLQLSKGQISRLISKLEEQGLIKVYVDALNGNKRSITTNKKVNKLCLNKDIGMSENVNTLYANMPINNIEDKIYINTSTTSEKIKSNLNLLDSICKDKSLSKELLFIQIGKFSKYLVNNQKEVHKDDNDLFTHFGSWLDKIEIDNEFNLEKESDWFIMVFNGISKRKYRVTPKVKKLLKKNIDTGFTGAEMEAAIRNLYSSSFENKFHIGNSYKFATPEYLLKEDNLNKYLNFKI